MNKRKILKWTLIPLASVLVALTILIAIALNFILTPSKLTPIVEKTANSMLNADVKMENVQLTFFSTFPKFHLKLDEVSVVSRKSYATDSLVAAQMMSAARKYTRRQLLDSLVPAGSGPSDERMRQGIYAMMNRRDSLLSVSRCALVINPFSYLFKNRLIISELRLDDASLYAYIDPEGEANWDILKESREQDPADTLSSMPEVIELKKVQMRNSDLIYNDRSNHSIMSLSQVNTDMGLSFGEDSLKVALDFSTERLFMTQGSTIVSKNARVALKADLKADDRTMRLSNAMMKLNEMSLMLDGSLTADTVNHFMMTDLNFRAAAPSVEKALNLVPETVLRRSDVDARGKISLSGTVRGPYGKSTLPVVTANMVIEDAAAHFKGLPYGVDELTAHFDALLDFKEKGDSFIDLKIFKMKAMDTDILADARVTQVFSDPLIALNTRSKIGLDALFQTFPFQPGMLISGRADLDFRVKTRLSSLTRQNYGKIFAEGRMVLDSVVVKDSAGGFEFSSDAEVDFHGKEALGGKALISSLKLNSRLGNAYLKNMTMNVVSERPKDTSRIFNVKADVLFNKLYARQGDSILLYCKQGAMRGELEPQKSDPTRPFVYLSLHSDSLSTYAQGILATLQKGHTHISAWKMSDTSWTPSAEMNFDRVSVRLDDYRLPIVLDKTVLKYYDDRFILNKAQLNAGQSNLVMTGELSGLLRGIYRKGNIKGHLDVASSMINCDQLINAYQPGGSAQADAASATDIEVPDTAATQVRLFKVPDNVEFQLNAYVKTLKFGKILLTDLLGKVEVSDSHVYLENLSMNSMGAKMDASVIYRAATHKLGYTGFDLNIKGIDVSRLVASLPAVDTLVPMLNSFKGKVYAKMAAEAVLDSAMNIQIPSLRAAMKIKGSDLVLMDGQTFAEISKKLMFKNKKENLIDSISVNVTVDDGNIKIYPFIVEIDRYRAAVGGTQYLDMSFDYHISILKSPLPFKAGVNIRGNLDKMKFGIGRAKYKNAVTPAEIYKVDTMRVRLDRNITEKFKSVAARKKWSHIALDNTRKNWKKKADSTMLQQKTVMEKDSIDWEDQSHSVRKAE